MYRKEFYELYYVAVFIRILDYGKKSNKYMEILYLARFQSKETDFRMSNSIINNLTSTDQTKLFFI